jgi:hypothetical protein
MWPREFHKIRGINKWDIAMIAKTRKLRMARRYAVCMGMKQRKKDLK